MIETDMNWQTVVALTFVAGLAMPLGALIASFEHIKSKCLQSELRHSITAFGGGALLSAVALVLVPEGIQNLGLLEIILSFSLGGFAFAWLDLKIKKSGSQASNFIAMLSDFIPEALALGASCVAGGKSAVLIAILIALQNTPEGFNTYRELLQSGMKSRSIITALIVISLLGPLSGLLGFYVLGGYPLFVSMIMLFASGGILYVVFQDIAPQAVLQNSWKPSIGAVLGFMLGLAGHVLTQG
jgi:ZIP family zinc transporter